LAQLDGEDVEPDPEFPFVLSAGERRAYTAMTLIRDPEWRKRDADGALRMSTGDALQLGLEDGALARVSTRRGRCLAPVETTDDMRRGHISLPNGYGLEHGPDGAVSGVPPNELTSSSRRDWLAGTPWHKNVPARIEKVAEP
jgi:anaerobic selenocysteine-containing dehydrogenase